MNETTNQNQRNGYRLPVRLPFSIVAGVGNDEITIPAESINLSKSGMRVRTEKQLSYGQTVEVILQEGTPHPVAARVVWVSKPNGPNHYEFGLEYITPSPQSV